MNEYVLDDIANEFFREFSRYEYCLKRVGLRTESRTASACWKKYAAEVRGVIENATGEVEAVVTYLKENPPRKQIIENGELEWSDRLPDHDNDSELILLLICRVRNNLFHGGKFNGRWFEPDRSENLIRYALTILRACKEFHPKVREAYEGQAF